MDGNNSHKQFLNDWYKILNVKMLLVNVLQTVFYNRENIGQRKINKFNNKYYLTFWTAQILQKIRPNWVLDGATR